MPVIYDLRFAMQKKSGGWRFGVVVSFRLLATFVLVLDILRRSGNDESFSEPCSPPPTLNRVFP